MKLKKSMTITLTDSQVKEIIAEKCRSLGYDVSAKDVHMDMKAKDSAPVFAELKFTGCTISTEINEEVKI